jgi:hypothetical protein
LGKRKEKSRDRWKIAPHPPFFQIFGYGRDLEEMGQWEKSHVMSAAGHSEHFTNLSKMALPTPLQTTHTRARLSARSHSNINRATTKHKNIVKNKIKKKKKKSTMTFKLLDPYFFLIAF